MSAFRIASSIGEYEPQWKTPPPPKKEKLSLRDSYKRKLLALPPEKRQKARQRVRLKRASKGLKAEQAKYRRLSAKFLAMPENKWCEICERRRGAGENIVRHDATETHHYAGRIGRLLCYVPYFIASCWHCRLWPHQNPKRARELRLLAPSSQWNQFPVDGKG